MKSRHENLLIALYWLLGLGFVFMSIAAGIRHYSPVPFGDMWFGYLEFFRRLDEGGEAHWWAQHNEHRILLSRLLFWFDLAVLKGVTPFLQVINYMLALALWVVLCLLASKSMSSTQAPRLMRYLPPLLLIPCFSLMQHENFYWGFQSQFFLVNLLPLSGFYCLSRSNEPEASKSWFWAACALGILSIGSMANGVLALPIMVLQALLLRSKTWRLSTLAILSAGVLLAYFWDYQASRVQGSVTTYLLSKPLDLIHYVLLYLGSPFHHLVGGSPKLAMFMGLFLLGSSVFFLVRIITGKLQSTYPAALLALLLFIGGTALGTGGGRLAYGLEQALSYRYATPALLAWSALLILYAQYLAPKLLSNNKLLVLGLALPLSAFPAQFHFMKFNHFPSAFEGKLAVISLQMGVEDSAALRSIAIGTNQRWYLDEVTKYMSKHSLSIFSLPEIQRVSIPLGSKADRSPAPNCQGHIDAIDSVEGDDRFVWIRGWLFYPATRQTPKWINIVDQNGRIAGYALPGQERNDVARIIDPHAQYAGFAGYFLKSSASGPLSIRAEQPDCSMAFLLK